MLGLLFSASNSTALSPLSLHNENLRRTNAQKNGDVLGSDNDGGGSGSSSGTHIDDYDVVKPIGKGKFAMVYRRATVQSDGGAGLFWPHVQYQDLREGSRIRGARGRVLPEKNMVCVASILHFGVVVKTGRVRGARQRA